MNLIRNVSVRRFALALALALASGFAFAQTIKVEADAWMPYTGDPSAARLGYTVEITKAILEKAGYKMDYQQVPWVRCIKDAQAGTADIILVMYAEDAAAERLLIPTRNMGLSANRFFTLKTNPWTYAGPPSLATQSLGIIKSYNYGEINTYIAGKHDPATRVQIIADNNPLEMNLRKLIAGRITVTVDDALVVADTARSIGVWDQLRDAGALGKPIAVFPAISPKSPRAAELVKLFDTGMAALRSSGELKRILDRYGIADWEK